MSAGTSVTGDLYARLLGATLALHPAGRTPVRTVRAALTGEVPWVRGPGGAVLLVDAAMDARLQLALGRTNSPAESPMDRTAAALQVRLEIHHLVGAVLATMAAGDPGQPVAPLQGGLRHSTLRTGLADFLAEADLDRIAGAAGIAADEAPGARAVYECGSERQAVEPLLRALAGQLHEDPVVLARSLFSEAPIDVGLLRLGRRVIRSIGLGPESPEGRGATVPALLETLMAPLAAAERMSVAAAWGLAIRGDRSLPVMAMHEEYGRAMFAEAGRLAAQALQDWMARSDGEVPPPATATTAATASTPSRRPGPSSSDELFVRARLAVGEMIGGTCKAVRIQEGYEGLVVSEHLAGAYRHREGVIALHHGILRPIDDLIRTQRPSDGGLEDRVARHGRAAVQARCANTLLHELLHATDELPPRVHQREAASWGSWQFPIGEAITELAAQALLPEFLVNTGLAGIDAVLLEVEPAGAYGAQTSAFKPVVQQVADWLGISLREELVALKRAGGPEASMHLMAEQVTSALGLDGDPRFRREVARPRIRSAVQDGMAALQASLDGGPDHTLRGDPFGGLVAQRLRDTAHLLVDLHGQSARHPLGRWSRHRHGAGAVPRPAPGAGQQGRFLG